MDTIIPLGCSPASTAIGLLLEALGASDSYDYLPVRGLPSPAIHVPERDALIAVTSAASPLFAAQIEAVAAEHHLDVVLLRVGEARRGGPIGVDVALGSLPCAVWAERGFTLYHDAGNAWLVPALFGAAVSVSPDGFCLEIIPPYASLAEREHGIQRAAHACNRILQPAEVR